MISRLARRAALLLAIVSVAVAIPLSVALASHQFGDVPDSNIFHNDIAALAASGVTTGCGGGNFCPKDFVTREQMAAFLNRLGLTPVNGRAGNFAYAWANSASAPSYTPNASYSYNSGGGPITITRSGVGSYLVTFGGLDLAQGHIQVTKYGPGPGECHVVSWGAGSVAVECYDLGGTAADYRYTVMFID